MTTMTDIAQHQRAKNAYLNAAEFALTSNQIWLRSLLFITQKLKEAQHARREDDFERAFTNHRKIYRVLGVLQQSLPDPFSLGVDDPLSESASFLFQFYQKIRARLNRISALKDADLEYSKLIDEVDGLQRHLSGLPTIHQQISPKKG